MAPGWHLTVWLRSPTSPGLQGCPTEISNRVTFSGWKPREEVYRLMRDESELFLFPSLHDDSPFAVVEAMAAGLPVLCLDCVWTARACRS